MSVTTLPRHPKLGAGDDVFTLHVADGKVERLEINLGRHRRDIERLIVRKTWDQALILVERVCGMCSISHSAAAVVALEQTAGIKATERAEKIRTMLCELERIHSHLIWLGMIAHALGLDAAWMWTWKYGEPVSRILERISGSRHHIGLFVPGGILKNLEDDEIPWYRKALEEIKPVPDLLGAALVDAPLVRARTRGIGRLSNPQAEAFQVTGPTARASGIARDVRIDRPYFAYANLTWTMPVLEAGDVQARIMSRVLEISESLGMIGRCLDRLKPGAIRIVVPSYPEGEGSGHIEAPRGELIHRIRSDGSNHPMEYGIRPPSEVNLRVLEALCVGIPVEDAAVVLASIDPCFACADRMTVLDHSGGDRSITWHDLVRLSRETTGRLSGSTVFA